MVDEDVVVSVRQFEVPLLAPAVVAAVRGGVIVWFQPPAHTPNEAEYTSVARDVEGSAGLFDRHEP